MSTCEFILVKNPTNVLFLVSLQRRAIWICTLEPTPARNLISAINVISNAAHLMRWKVTCHCTTAWNLFNASTVRRTSLEVAICASTLWRTKTRSYRKVLESLWRLLLDELYYQFSFKENVRYPVWTCTDPIYLILGTRGYFLWF